MLFLHLLFRVVVRIDENMHGDGCVEHQDEGNEEEGTVACQSRGAGGAAPRSARWRAASVRWVWRG